MRLVIAVYGMNSMFYCYGAVSHPVETAQSRAVVIVTPGAGKSFPGAGEFYPTGCSRRLKQSK